MFPLEGGVFGWMVLSLKVRKLLHVSAVGGVCVRGSLLGAALHSKGVTEGVWSGGESNTTVFIMMGVCIVFSSICSVESHPLHRNRRKAVIYGDVPAGTYTIM